MNKLNWDGKEYELAPKTMGLARIIDAAEKAPTVIESYRKQWEMVISALGENAAHEVLQAQNIEKVDVIRLTQVYNDINFTYEEPLREMRKRHDAETLNSPVFDIVKSTAEDVKTIESAGKNLK